MGLRSGCQYGVARGQDALFFSWPALSPIHWTPRTDRQLCFPSLLEIGRRNVCFPDRLEAPPPVSQATQNPNRLLEPPPTTSLLWALKMSLALLSSPHPASGFVGLSWAACKMGPRPAHAQQCILSQGGRSSGGGVASIPLLSLLLSCPVSFPRK